MMELMMIPLMIAGEFDGVESLSDVLCPPKSKALEIRRKPRLLAADWQPGTVHDAAELRRVFVTDNVEEGK